MVGTSKEIEEEEEEEGATAPDIRASGRQRMKNKEILPI